MAGRSASGPARPRGCKRVRRTSHPAAPPSSKTGSSEPAPRDGEAQTPRSLTFVSLTAMGRRDCYFHFISEETEAQKCGRPWSRSSEVKTRDSKLSVTREGETVEQRGESQGKQGSAAGLRLPWTHMAPGLGARWGRDVWRTNDSGGQRGGRSQTPQEEPRSLRAQLALSNSSCHNSPCGSLFSRHFSDEEPGGSVAHPGPPEPPHGPLCHLSLSPTMLYCEGKDRSLGLKALKPAPLVLESSEDLAPAWAQGRPPRQATAGVHIVTASSFCSQGLRSGHYRMVTQDPAGSRQHSRGAAESTWKSQARWERQDSRSPGTAVSRERQPHPLWGPARVTGPL